MATNIRKQNDRYVNDVITTTQSDEIHITEDKLRLKLIKHFDRYRKSKEWIAYLGNAVAIGIALMTTTFNETWGIPAYIWRDIVWVAEFFFIYKFIVSLFNTIRYNISIDKIIQVIES